MAHLLNFDQIISGIMIEAAERRYSVNIFAGNELELSLRLIGENSAARFAARIKFFNQAKRCFSGKNRRIYQSGAPISPPYCYFDVIRQRIKKKRNILFFLLVKIKNYDILLEQIYMIC